jgi:hypothetical protein
MFKVFAIMTFVTIFANVADASYNVDVETLHSRAVEIFRNANYQIQNNRSNDLIKNGLRNYFTLSMENASDSRMIDTIFSNIQSISHHINETKYKVYSHKKGLWCITNPLAIVPPPKNKVHLCPSFFSSLNRNQQIGTIIHEWFHLWGGNKINYIPEKYCYESVSLGPGRLIRNADQYMLFIFSVGTNGEYLPCF